MDIVTLRLAKKYASNLSAEKLIEAKNYADTLIGDLNNLPTEDKEDIVKAIIEIFAMSLLFIDNIPHKYNLVQVGENVKIVYEEVVE